MSEESKKQVEEDAPLTEEEARAVVGGNDSEGMDEIDPDTGETIQRTSPVVPFPNG